MNTITIPTLASDSAFECRAEVQTEDSELGMINPLINTIQALDSDNVSLKGSVKNRMQK